LPQLREVVEVLIDEGVAGAAEAREAVLHIGRVARLGEFAVIDEIDAGIGLLCTISATAERTRAPSASRSTGTPSSLAYIMRIKWSGRGRCRCGW